MMPNLPRTREQILMLITSSGLYQQEQRVVTHNGQFQEKNQEQVKRRRLGTRTPHRPAPLPQVNPMVREDPKTMPRSPQEIKNQYQIVWRRGYPGIKHKRFTGDGTLKIAGCSANLHDGDGRVLGEVTPFKPEDFLEGNILLVGPYECQLCE